MRNLVEKMISGRLAGIRGRLKRYFLDGWNWWIAELSEILPRSIRAYIDKCNQRTFLLLFDRDVVVFHGSIADMRQVGRFRLDDPSGPATPLPEGAGQLVLLLPPGNVLTKTLTLPAVTEENLREVLRFEMDRETPFEASDVYFEGIVAGRSPANRSIDVDLVLTPKRFLDDLLNSLAAAGLAPDVVATNNTAGAMYGINLLPANRAPVRPASWNSLNAVLGAAALLLLAIAIALPIQRKLDAIESLEPRVLAAMEAAKEGTELRDRIDDLTSTMRVLVDRKETERTVMALLDELTRVLPDGTWIERLDIADQEIQLQGISPSTASLIGLIEASEPFYDPRFVSPVTQLQSSALERFHLSVRWMEGLSDD